MGEVHQVRLVVCPNCWNLLPELPDFSIYKCGACDSVLQAKKKVGMDGGSFEKSGQEEEGSDGFKELGKILGYASKSSKGLSNNRREERFSKQRTVDVGAERSLKEQNPSLVNKAERGNYSFQSKGTGVDSWRSSMDRRRFSSDGGSHVAFSCRPGSISYSNLNTGAKKEPDRPIKIARVEQDQEFMWKLDELKGEAGVRSWPKGDRVRERAISDRTRPCYFGHDPVKRLQLPSYTGQCGLGHVLCPHRHETDVQKSSVLQNDLFQTMNPPFKDPIRPRTCRHRQPPPPDHFPKQSLYTDQEFVMPYPYQAPTSRPACSCFHCDRHNSRASMRGPPIIPGRRGPSQKQMDQSFNHQHVNPVSVGPSRTTRSNDFSMSQLRDHRSKVRWRSSMDTDADSFDWHRPSTRKALEPGRNRRSRHWHPVAGGAPFIICCNCLELLRLPNVVDWRGKNNTQKLQCGACSIKLSLTIQNKKLIVSPQGDKKQASDRNHNLPGNGVLSPVLLPNAGASAKRRSNDSSLSFTGEEAEALEAMSAHKDDSSSPESPSKHEEPVGQGSYSHDHLNDAASADGIDRVGEVNVSEIEEINEIDEFCSGKRSEQDKMVTTGVDVSFREYPNGDWAQESSEFSKEAKVSKISKGVESFLVNFVRKSFKDLSLSSHQKGRNDAATEVFVNGHPIPHHQVVKAEKLAGTVSPGDYWYDWKAGFWGVIGKPCLGILPPFIEEFTYPMPANCAAGNTGVYVNGRELHESDLELLLNKGLPTAKDKFYMIDFFGRVVDKGSGEEVANLGGLAPTVAREKRGFGMWVPGETL